LMSQVVGKKELEGVADEAEKRMLTAMDSLI